jgi:hypothetical protein
MLSSTEQTWRTFLGTCETQPVRARPLQHAELVPQCGHLDLQGGA